MNALDFLVKLMIKIKKRRVLIYYLKKNKKF